MWCNKLGRTVLKRATALAVCIFLAPPIARTQTARPAFEVASVKRHEVPPGIMGLQIGGPSTLHISGNRLTTSGSLTMLVMAAYNLRLPQVSGVGGVSD